MGNAPKIRMLSTAPGYVSVSLLVILPFVIICDILAQKPEQKYQNYQTGNEQSRANQPRSPDIKDFGHADYAEYRQRHEAAIAQDLHCVNPLWRARVMLSRRSQLLREF